MGDARLVVPGDGGGGGGGGSFFVDRAPSTNAPYVSGIPRQSFGSSDARACSMTSDGKYIVVGLGVDISGGGDPSGVPSGIVKILKRDVGTNDVGTYSVVATITRPGAGSVNFGGVVAINDNLSIFVGSDQSSSADCNARIYTPTGIDTWDAGVDLGISAVKFASFAQRPNGDERIVIYAGWNGAPVAEAASVHVWAKLSGTWTDQGAVTLDTQGESGATWIHAVFDEQGLYIAALYSVDDTGTGYIQIFHTSDFITWTGFGSFTHGATDGNADGPAFPGSRDTIAWSIGDYKPRVLIATNEGVQGTISGNVGVSGLYVYQVTDALFPAYAQSAVLLGDTSSSMHAAALSADGQFAAVGSSFSDVSITNDGAAYGISRLQSLSGVANIAGHPRAIQFSTPSLGSAYNFGTALAMNWNGQIVAVMLSSSGTGTPAHEVFTFDQALDDLLGFGGVANDYFDNAIVLDPGLGTHTLDPVKMTSASLEQDEPQPSGAPGQMRNTLWYKLVPTTNCTLDADTLTSETLNPLDSGTPFGDSLLQLWTGTTLAGLTEVPAAFSDDDGSVEGYSQITGVALTSGTTYYLQVGVYFGDDAFESILRYTLT